MHNNNFMNKHVINKFIDDYEESIRTTTSSVFKDGTMARILMSDIDYLFFGIEETDGKKYKTSDSSYIEIIKDNSKEKSQYSISLGFLDSSLELTFNMGFHELRELHRVIGEELYVNKNQEE